MCLVSGKEAHISEDGDDKHGEEIERPQYEPSLENDRSSMRPRYQATAPCQGTCRFTAAAHSLVYANVGLGLNLIRQGP